MLERRTQRIVSGVSRRAFFAAPARLMATNAAASHFPKRTPPFSRRLLSAPRSYPSLRYGWRPRRRLTPLRGDAGDARLRLIAVPHNIRAVNRVGKWRTHIAAVAQSWLCERRMLAAFTPNLFSCVCLLRSFIFYLGISTYYVIHLLTELWV